jgi:hypothetical protein
MDKKVKELLNDYKESLSNGKHNFKKAWHYCADEKMPAK